MKTTAPGRRGIRAIKDAFDTARRQHRPALITYLTAGYPTESATLELVAALQEGGADLIELGVPFSDPVADGPTIQQAAQVALQEGITPERCLELVSVLRQRGLNAPLVMMGYYNPIYAYGLDRYAQRCATVGADGLIVPDLPPEEAGPLREACDAHELALIYLVAPTSSETRIAALAQQTRGFLYVVSRLGITGAGKAPAQAELCERLAVIRRYATTPVAVGFGISRPDQVRDLAGDVDGLIVGSAIVSRAAEGTDAVRTYVQSLRRAMTG